MAYNDTPTKRLILVSPLLYYSALVSMLPDAKDKTSIYLLMFVGLISYGVFFFVNRPTPVENETIIDTAEPEVQNQVSSLTEDTPVSVTSNTYQIELILNCTVAGFQHYDGFKVARRLQYGEPLILQRDPNNSYDSNAVKVLIKGRQENRMLGHIPREFAYNLAKLMDSGQYVVDAMVSRYNPKETYFHMLEINVFKSLKRSTKT